MLTLSFSLKAAACDKSGIDACDTADILGAADSSAEGAAVNGSGIFSDDPSGSGSTSGRLNRTADIKVPDLCLFGCKAYKAC